MPQYRLYVIFDLKDTTEETTQHQYDHIKEFENIQEAEDALKDIISKMVADYSARSLEWTLVNQQITLQKEEQDNNHTQPS